MATPLEQMTVYIVGRLRETPEGVSQNDLAEGRPEGTNLVDLLNVTCILYWAGVIRRIGHKYQWIKPFTDEDVHMLRLACQTAGMVSLRGGHASQAQQFRDLAAKLG